MPMAAPSGASLTGSVKVASTNSASPTTCHSIPATTKTQKIAVFAKNMDNTQAIDLFLRSKNNATNSDYEQFTIPARATGADDWVCLWPGFNLASNGSNTTDVQAYASVTNQILLRFEIYEGV